MQPTSNSEPLGFKSLSSVTIRTFKPFLIRGYHLLIQNHENCLKRCLISKASLQLTTDRLPEQCVPDSAINEFEGGITNVINECEKSGSKTNNPSTIKTI